MPVWIYCRLISNMGKTWKSVKVQNFIVALHSVFLCENSTKLVEPRRVPVECIALTPTKLSSLIHSQPWHIHKPTNFEFHFIQSPVDEKAKDLKVSPSPIEIFLWTDMGVCFKLGHQVFVAVKWLKLCYHLDFQDKHGDKEWLQHLLNKPWMIASVSPYLSTPRPHQGRQTVTLPTPLHSPTCWLSHSRMAYFPYSGHIYLFHVFRYL